MKKGPSASYELDEYESKGVSIVVLAEEGDDFRVTLATFEPGGSIGAHPCGSPQLFHVVTGRGWVSGADGVRATIAAGEHVVWDEGEEHASGTNGGMTAVIVQSTDPELFSSAVG